MTIHLDGATKPLPLHMVCVGLVDSMTKIIATLNRNIDDCRSALEGSDGITDGHLKLFDQCVQSTTWSPR